MKRNPSDAQLIARVTRYNVDDMGHSESPPVYTGPPPVFQPPHSKFSALGSITSSDIKSSFSTSSIDGVRINSLGDDVPDSQMKKVFSFSGYVGTPHVSTHHDGLGLLHPDGHRSEHSSAHHLDNGIDAITPPHYNECAKALSAGSHAVLDRLSDGTATPSPTASPPASPRPAVASGQKMLGVDARVASQSHGSLLDIASSLFHRPQKLHTEQPAAGTQAARLGAEHRLKSRGSEPNFLSSRFVGGSGKASSATTCCKHPLVSAQDLNAMAPLDL